MYDTRVAYSKGGGSYHMAKSRYQPPRRPWYFVSLRWRVIAPLALAVLVVGMLGAYLVGDALARSAEERETERVLAAARAVSERMQALGEAQGREALRIAYTEGVARLVRSADAAALHALLKPLAAAADLDYVLVADAEGQELLGLQRVRTAEGAYDYAVASGTDLAALIVGVLPRGGAVNVAPPLYAALARTGTDHALLTAAPITLDGAPIGTVLAGVQLSRALEKLGGGGATELALFGANGEFLRTTFAFDERTRDALRLSPALYTQALASPGQVPMARAEVNGRAYRTAYVPLVVNGTPLGVVGVYVEDHTFYAALVGEQTLGVLAAALVGLVTVIAFVVVGGMAGRLERVTRVARALALGHPRARTRFRPTDEIGELGAALDELADAHKRRTDTLQKALRRQRARVARLNAVLASIPDGIVVQDLDGRVVLLNDAARQLLGGHRAFRSARLHELTAQVTEKLGRALAPGVYALGDPARIPVEGKMLQAQAAAIVTDEQKRLGTVIVLRDITDEVRREQQRDRLLDHIAERAHVPTAPQTYDSLAALAREFVQNTRAIQRTIAELRTLSTLEPPDLADTQQALPLNALVWRLAAEWQPLARAARCELRVKFGARGDYVLGDERRLRWALGNIVDNALKFSPPHTTITLEARRAPDDPACAEIVVRDQGYGVAADEVERVFTRFFRGTPRDREGQPVHKPGTGQGLYIARRVIEAHGGSVSLQSAVGLGTTVTVRLPLTADVTLPLMAEDALPAADLSDEAGEDVPLSDGAYNTVPLEPRRFPWQRE